MGTQVIARATYHNNWAAARGYLAIWGGNGDWGQQATFGIDSVKCVLPTDCTIHDLGVSILQAHPAATLTLLKNGVATSLTVTVDATGTTGADTVNRVECVAGDDLVLRLDGTLLTIEDSYALGFSLAIDHADDHTSVYGVPSFPGSVGLNAGVFGGALGNGFFQQYDAVATDSTTYSLTALPGAVTGLRLKTYAGAPGAGVWTGYLRKNGILQDGSGGTVDTACVMTGAATAASSSFSLAVALTDHLDVVVIRSGLAAPFAVAQVCASVIFTAATTNRFMFCGGSNTTLNDRAPTWLWIKSGELVEAELLAVAPIGPEGLFVAGLYGEFSLASLPGSGWTVMVRRNQADTVTTFTIDGATVSGSSQTAQAFLASDVIGVQLTPINGPALGEFHWGVVGSLSLPQTRIQLTQLPIEAAYGFPVMQPLQSISAQIWNTPQPVPSRRGR